MNYSVLYFIRKLLGIMYFFGNDWLNWLRYTLKENIKNDDYDMKLFNHKSRGIYADVNINQILKTQGGAPDT